MDKGKQVEADIWWAFSTCIFSFFINNSFFDLFCLGEFCIFLQTRKWVDAYFCEENSCISTEVFCICAIIFVYFLLN